MYRRQRTVATVRRLFTLTPIYSVRTYFKGHLLDLKFSERWNYRRCAENMQLHSINRKSLRSILHILRYVHRVYWQIGRRVVISKLWNYDAAWHRHHGERILYWIPLEILFFAVLTRCQSENLLEIVCIVHVNQFQINRQTSNSIEFYFLAFDFEFHLVYISYEYLSIRIALNISEIMSIFFVLFVSFFSFLSFFSLFSSILFFIAHEINLK